jgi:amino acid adenylation domain-containing protein
VTAAHPADTTITRRDGQGPAPLSFPQERMFLLDRIMPGIPAYNVPRLARVARTLDAGVLQRALDAIVARHEILRTRIVLVGGEPMQEVAPEAHVELTVADVSDLPVDKREARALQQVAAVAWRSFDVGQDVLLRAALVHVGPDDDLLLLVNHHLASDHASGAILFAELSDLYAAIEIGCHPDLPELPLQYADFAVWQRARLSGPFLEQLLAYWRTALAGAPDRLELPTDRQRPPVQTYRGGVVDVELEPDLVERLRAVARGAKVTLYVVLLAAFKALLHRYSGQTDLVVGTPVSGRHHQETAPLVGYFSNTLPLRTDLGGDPTFEELLGRVRQVTLAALAHQELPFERLVEELNPDRKASRTPVFQVLFGFDIDAATERTFAGAPLERLPIPAHDWARFDLSIVVREHSDGSVSGLLEYSSDLFERSTAERLLGHLHTLLETVARNPGERLSRLPLLTEEERRRMLVGWNATDADYPRRCLHELFAAQTLERQDAVAVEFRDQRLTYAELDRRSSQLARELQALGAGRDTLVAICLERGLDLVVALLAVLKCGAAYVPIDPTYPSDRQAFMLEDAQAPVLLTQSALAATVPEHAAAIVCLDTDWPRIASRPATPPAVPADPDQLAYVIYTSGSTGKPKGVEITHRSVVNLISHMSAAPGLTADDVVANLTTPAFDLSVPDWYLPLCHGARLVIVPREETLDGVRLAERIDRCGATFVQATPTTWQLLVDAAWAGNPRLKIVCGGEVLPRALANELVARGSSLWHTYGPTETTVWSSILQLETGDGLPPLGGPIANTRFYVLDEQRQPQPLGVPGELYIGGDGLARGYRNRPELTAEKFVRDRFSAGAGRRLYRTGDLVRWREGGMLEFLGRIDLQVKLRGFRIELGEIEAVLAEHPEVGAAVAVVREDAPGDRRLVAYVVPSGDTAPNEAELRRLARAQLPEYMIPAAFVVLDSLPVSANRKLDRAALPPPAEVRPTLERAYTPAATPVEETLVELWQGLLGIDRVGADDNFFDLGGHSLLAVKMLSRVRDALGVEVPLTTIFNQPTVRGLAAVVASLMLEEAGDDDLAAFLAEIEAADQPAP